MLSLRPGMQKGRNVIMKKLVEMQYTRNEIDFKRGTFRAKGDILEIYPSNQEESALRVEFWGDEIEKIAEINPLTGKPIGIRSHVLIGPNSHYVAGEDLTKIATDTISEITHYTTVAIGPEASNNIISDVKLISLGNRLLMAVVLTENGAIKETIIKYNEDITDSQVENLNYLFKKKLIGKPLTKIDKPMEEYILESMEDQVDVIKPIIKQMNKSLEQSEHIYLEGANNVFDFPEFRKIDTARNFLSILDTKEQVMEILNSGLAKDINVYIGEENEQDALKDLSVVTFKHTVGNKDLGTIGIIGPKRMDYSKVISVMKYISKKLNEKFKNDE